MTKIPEFPQFKAIELADKTEVERLTRKFRPYSDFSFSSMWAWDIKNKMKLSKLNKNLVILFNDYVSNEPFISFIGRNKISETAKTLIDYSRKHCQSGLLKLISEEIAEILPKDKFVVETDKDSYDYIYSVTNLANMNGWPKSSSKKRLKQFIKKYPDYSIKLASIQEINRDEHLKMFQKWAENKNIPNYFELNEYKAFKKFLELEDNKIKVVSLYVNNNLIGFTVYEIQADSYALSHFAKADTTFHSGVYDVLNWEEAKILEKQGIRYYNWEQDLGLFGLRKSKEKYKPSFFLKKFTVSL